MTRAISSPQSAQSRLDTIGAAASFVCALHCALLPLLAALLPYAGFDVLQSHAFDRAFAVFATVFGLVVIGGGACRQRLALVLPLFVCGVVLLYVGAFAVLAGAWHPVLLALGGIAVAFAHVVNRHGISHHGCDPVNLWLLLFARAPEPSVAHK